MRSALFSVRQSSLLMLVYIFIWMKKEISSAANGNMSKATTTPDTHNTSRGARKELFNHVLHKKRYCHFASSLHFFITMMDFVLVHDLFYSHNCVLLMLLNENKRERRVEFFRGQFCNLLLHNLCFLSLLKRPEGFIQNFFSVLSKLHELTLTMQNL